MKKNNRSSTKAQSKNHETATDNKSKATSPLKSTFKKIISAGSASDISKELLSTALDQVYKAKDDISSIVTNEVTALIRRIDLVKEISKFAEDHKFKVSAEIEILKKDKTK